MADFTALKTTIQTYIKQNGNEEITGDILQEVLLAMVETMGDSSINDLVTDLSDEVTARQNADTTLGNSIQAIHDAIDNGYVYVGIATPTGTPVSGKVFYFAVTAGTYTNFGGLEVTQGINILKYNGSAWSVEQVVGIDDVPTAESENLVKSGGVQNELASGAVYDVSEKNPTAGLNNDGKFESLSALLSDANLNTLIPIAYRKGGMSVKFVQSSDNKYVQFRCMAQNFTTDVTQWQVEVESGVVNVNVIASHPSAYTSKNSARADIPLYLHKKGIIITYKLEIDSATHDTTCVYEQFISDDVSAWSLNTSWESLKKEELIKQIYKVTGIPYYFKKNGGSYNVYDMPLLAGDKIIYGVDQNSPNAPTGVFFIKEDNTYETLPSVGIGEEKEYVAPEAGYIRYYRASGEYIGYLSYVGLVQDVSKIDANLFDTISEFEHSGGLDLTDYCTIGETYTFGLSSDSPSTARVFFIYPDNSYEILISSLGIGELFNYKFTKSGHLRFYNASGTYKGYVVVRGTSSKTQHLIKNENAPLPLSSKILRRVGCIGDSYTAGYIKLGQTAIGKNSMYAWPHYMEALTNNKYDNWGLSGSTAKGWINGEGYLNLVEQEGNKCQAYVIALMINDQDSGNPNYTPVGVKTDIGTDADTYYAYYYKLIQRVVAVNSDAKIFCCTCYLYAEDYSYNIAVRDIVKYCQSNNQNVFLCDLASPYYNSEAYFQNVIFEGDKLSGHHSAIGYEFIAECMNRTLSDVINNNISAFQNVHLIDFDE